MLMAFSSFAIWDKNRNIMAISAALWVANMGFQFAGEFTFSISCESQRISYECDSISAIFKVNDHFQSLGLFVLFIGRVTLYGCLPQEHA
jgi:hypothetical protein